MILGTGFDLTALPRIKALLEKHGERFLARILTEEELSIVKRGRNAHAHHSAPKSASTQQYAGATGLEALLGYLYLTGQIDRLTELSPYLQAEDA